MLAAKRNRARLAGAERHRRRQTGDGEPAVVVWVSDTAVAALPSRLSVSVKLAAARQCSVRTGERRAWKALSLSATTKLPLVVALTDGVVVLRRDGERHRRPRSRRDANLGFHADVGIQTSRPVWAPQAAEMNYGSWRFMPPAATVAKKRKVSVTGPVLTARTR